MPNTLPDLGDINLPFTNERVNARNRLLIEQIGSWADANIEFLHTRTESDSVEENVANSAAL
jgi:hypothetical protein